MERSIPFRSKNDLQDRTAVLSTCLEALALEDQDDFANTKSILDARFEPISADEVAEQQQQPPQDSRRALAKLLKKFDKVFDGVLRKNSLRQFNLERGRRQAHALRPSAVPHNNLETFKKALEHLVHS